MDKRDNRLGIIVLKALIPLIFLGGVGALAYWMISNKEDQPSFARPPEPALVSVLVAEEQDVTFRVETQGTVSARTETSLVPEVSGQIVRVAPNFEVGGYFQEGDLILEIDPSNYEAALAQAQASLERARVTLSQERARSAQARRDWDELGEGEPSPLVLREPQMREAEANIQSAEASLARAQRDVERTRIRAPYDGMIREKFADLGQFVSPGTRLADIFAVDYAEVRLPLSSRDLAFLDLPSFYNVESADTGKQPVVYLKGNYGGRDNIWEGRIVRTSGTFDNRSRLTYAIARIEDPYGLERDSDLPPMPVGLYMEAQIMGKQYEDIVVLPRHVLRPDYTILVVNEENRIEVRLADVIRADSENVYLRGGVEDGERVCMTTLEYVVEGMPVRTFNPEGNQWAGRNRSNEGAPRIELPESERQADNRPRRPQEESAAPTAKRAEEPPARQPDA